jgi:hypothetical protein
MWLFKRHRAPSPEPPAAAAPAPRRRPAAGAAAAGAAAADSPFRKKLADAWDERSVGELRQELVDIGWDEASLDNILVRVGPPLGLPLPPSSAAREAEQQQRRAAQERAAHARAAKAVAALKRRRQQDEDDEDEDGDGEEPPPTESPRRAAPTPRSAPSPRSPGEKRVRKVDAGIPDEVAALSPRELRVRLGQPPQHRPILCTWAAVARV